ncbi:unnamed protein product, partial [Oikopleura dioica]
IVEKQLSGRKAWSTFATENPKCSINVTGLELGRNYNFRVLGENEYGVGVGAVIGPIRVCQTPGPITKFEITSASKSFANFVWAKPEYDGGSRITGYLIEWCKKADFDAKKDVEYVVRISAKSVAGVGEPREKIIAGRDPTEKPTLNTSDYPSNTVYLREGTSKKIKIPFTGKPKPAIKWKKLEEDDLYRMPVPTR